MRNKKDDRLEMRLSASLKAALVRRAAEEDTPISQIVRRAIKRELIEAGG